MRIRALLVTIALLCVAVLAPRADARAVPVGTLTLQSTTDVGNGVTRYTFTWVSTAGGAVSGNAQVIVKGHLKQIEFTPDAGGTQPTDLYDVTLLNERSVDLLNGQGANLSNAGAVMMTWGAPGLWHDDDDDLDIAVANAGAAKGGTVRVWIQR